jgi:hypothetical protein
MSLLFWKGPEEDIEGLYWAVYAIVMEKKPGCYACLYIRSGIDVDQVATVIVIAIVRVTAIVTVIVIAIVTMTATATAIVTVNSDSDSILLQEILKSSVLRL